MKLIFFAFTIYLKLFAVNSLIYENSPYLQQHAHNPVNWYAYNQKSLKKAKKEHKLIFLSIGYSTCHWCHVMAEESFENTKIAKLLNDGYVAIKVDREEMPHIDSYYQQLYLKRHKHSGGWPLNVILDENMNAFYIQTYIPPTFMYNHEGMDTLLPRLSHEYKNHIDKIREKVKQFKLKMSTKTDKKPQKKVTTELIFSDLQKEYDSLYFGFSKRAKFPQAPKIELLLTLAKLGEKKAQNMAFDMLDAMALKGLYDDVDGGFFRYCVDSAWEIPHFEKMLYNQAELINVYVKAYKSDPKKLYKDVVKETIDMVNSHFEKNGLFLSASSADSNNHEGEYFTFTEQEIQKALKNTPNADEIESAYELDFANFKSQYHLVNHKAKRVKGFKKFIKNLKEFRKHKKYPFIDTKIITSWNAMMIEALYRASYFDKKQIKTAEYHLNRLLKHHYKNGILYHQSILGKEASKVALLEDYSSLVTALITAYEFTYNKRDLHLAVELMDKSIKKFYKDGIWYLNEDGLHVKADLRDKYYTSALAKTLQNLFKLSSLKDNLYFKNIALKSFKALYIDNFADTPATDIALLMREFPVISLKHSKKMLNRYRKKIDMIEYPFIVTKVDNSGLFLACKSEACFAYSKNFLHVKELIEKIGN